MGVNVLGKVTVGRNMDDVVGCRIHCIENIAGAGVQDRRHLELTSLQQVRNGPGLSQGARKRWFHSRWLSYYEGTTVERSPGIFTPIDGG